MNQFQIDTSRPTIPQGDVYLIPIKALPAGIKNVPADNGVFVITHSESGHDHVIDERPEVKQYEPDPTVYEKFSAMDQFRGFLEVGGEESVELRHLREVHTHETQIVPPGLYLIQRQMAHTPAGWKRAID